MKDMTCFSFPSNLLNTTYIDSSDVSWYAYNREEEKSKLKVSEHVKNDIKELCIRASIELANPRLARVAYSIVPSPVVPLFIEDRAAWTWTLSQKPRGSG